MYCDLLCAYIVLHQIALSAFWHSILVHSLSISSLGDYTSGWQWSICTTMPDNMSCELRDPRTLFLSRVLVWYIPGDGSHSTEKKFVPVYCCDCDTYAVTVQSLDSQLHQNYRQIMRIIISLQFSALSIVKRNGLRRNLIKLVYNA